MVVDGLAFDHMERVRESRGHFSYSKAQSLRTLPCTVACVLLRLVQHGAVNENERACRTKTSAIGTDFWRKSRCIPAGQASITYPSSRGACCSGASVSKSVPPSGTRTKRFVILVVRCEPGRNDSAPFEAVQSSSANLFTRWRSQTKLQTARRSHQKPRALGGSVYCKGGSALFRLCPSNPATNKEGPP